MLDFFGGVCYTIIVPRKGNLSRLEKNFEKVKKGLDKPNRPWYNKNVPRERKWKGSQKKL